jgi:hypothetical protein
MGDMLQGTGMQHARVTVINTTATPVSLKFSSPSSPFTLSEHTLVIHGNDR